MVVFQKLEGKTTTLNFWNQKNGRKFYYSQKLCFDRIFEIKKMEGNSTTPKNCVLTEFLKSKKWKEILLLPKIVFWQNFWNQKNGRKFYYSQKLCFDRIFEIKKMEGNSTTPKNCVLTEFLKSKKWKEILLLPKIVFWQNFCMKGVQFSFWFSH